jgi:hypothetical protein
MTMQNVVHEVKIRLVDGRHAVPEIPSAMEVGDTVRYASPDGEFRIKFPRGSPFGYAEPGILEIKTGEPFLLEREGHFFCECHITPVGSSDEIGWDPVASPQSGGEHNVGHKK